MLARFVFTVLAFVLAVDAFGKVSEVIDGSNFCVYLPPEEAASRNIADSEWQAEAYCTGTTPRAVDAGRLADGFILSAHYYSTDDFVQVTGRIDPATMRLNVSDDGGQMDIRAPKGSTCAGWQYYVNLIEPLTQTFCMRCCDDDRLCNRGISEKGCLYIIPGDYDSEALGPVGPTTMSAPSIPPNPANPAEAVQPASVPSTLVKPSTDEPISTLSQKAVDAPSPQGTTPPEKNVSQNSLAALPTQNTAAARAAICPWALALFLSLLFLLNA